MKVKSTRCGKGDCEFYDSSNSKSKCKKFADRSLCSVSNKQRRKAANHSKKQEINWY